MKEAMRRLVVYAEAVRQVCGGLADLEADASAPAKPGTVRRRCAADWLQRATRRRYDHGRWRSPVAVQGRRGAIKVDR
jgi:hypothetical protein